jgi:phosphoglycerol transferase MdoB-like AlkP superfamily enzyme
MVDYVILVLALTFVWALYAAVRVAPWLAKRWKAWGEVAAVLVFTVVELALLVAFLKPS